MNAITQAVDSQQASSKTNTFVIATLLVLASLGFLYFSSYRSMVEVWWRSETFAHGFLILPISLYVAWTLRRRLPAVSLATDYRALFVLALLGAGWLLSHLASILVLEQLLVTLMIPTVFWLCLGPALVRCMAFPLAFLIFAVPMGDSLVAPLMNYTAIFTVGFIRMLGIPVFWEGLYFSLPSGSWSVVEACSGFRYVMASLCLGSLYAYMTYQSFKRRMVFMLFALIVPIIANGLRAVMIVLLGHYSGMKLAVGVDHLIYGWVWFGVVMFLMFWLGSYWREEPRHADEESSPDTNREILSNNKSSAMVNTPTWAVIAAGIITLMIWPLWAGLSAAPDNGKVNLTDFTVHPDWQMADPISEWQPHFVGASQRLSQSYVSNANRVGIVLAHYLNQSQSTELINANNRVVASGQHRWRRLDTITAQLDLAGKRLNVSQSRLDIAGQNLLVWQWYWVNGNVTSRAYVVKALEVWAQLQGKSREGTALTLFAAYDDVPGEAEKVMKDFLQANWVSLERALQPPN